MLRFTGTLVTFVVALSEMGSTDAACMHATTKATLGFASRMANAGRGQVTYRISPHRHRRRPCHCHKRHFEREVYRRQPRQSPEFHPRRCDHRYCSQRQRLHLHAQYDRIRGGSGEAEDQVITQAKAHAWEKALVLHRSIEQTGKRPKASSYLNVMEAMAEGGHWAPALEILRSIRKAHFRLDTVCYTPVLKAFNKARLWSSALLLYEHVKLRDIMCHESFFTHAIEAAKMGGAKSKVQLAKIRLDTYNHGLDPENTLMPIEWLENPKSQPELQELRYCPPPNPVRFYVRMALGGMVNMYMSLNDTVGDAKIVLHRKTFLFVDHLWYRGRRLQDFR
mmetsp:Transcript_15839/g.39039  ORF Transcript_15839/g.39039 Transcript_15839/m.39039 type:complete len:336 (+) Transcript_15839:98-1105(+)